MDNNIDQPEIAGLKLPLENVLNHGLLVRSKVLWFKFPLNSIWIVEAMAISLLAHLNTNAVGQ